MLNGLASLWLTFACLMLAGLLVAGSLAADSAVGWEIAVPFGGLLVNLLAALAVHRSLRRQAGLLVFHLALAGLALSAALGRLTALSGRVEVTQGLPFSAALVSYEAGPLHRFDLFDGAFVQEGFSIDYDPGMKRRETRSQVRLADGRRVTVGDDTPLNIAGYRLYTTFNKGFAPILTFTDSTGESPSGALHLPSYPLFDYKQGLEWTPPGASRSVTVWLSLAKPIYDERKNWKFAIPEDALLVIDDGTRRQLRPGEEAPVAGGRVRYEELRSWMGYKIHYDASRPWLMASAIVAVIGLLWHSLGKLRGLGDLAEGRTRRVA